MNNEKTYIGTPKIKKSFVTKPQKRFRIIIQERKSRNAVEQSRSFMIYDFTGKINIDHIKRILMTTYKKLNDEE